MKKFFLIVFSALLIAIVCIYFFIPNYLTVVNSTLLKGSTNSINRTLQNQEKWKDLCTDNKTTALSPDFTSCDFFIQNEDTFRITQQLLNNLKILISNRTGSKKSVLSVVQWSQDSVALNWSFVDTTSWNPFFRIQQYRQDISTKNNIKIILNRIRKYASNNTNVYGIPIEETSTKDTLLVSLDSITHQYPTTSDIYNLIKQLQLYIVIHNAEQSGNPMLNVTELNSKSYKILVALPVNKKIPGENKISFKQLIPGKFITSRVVGGNQKIHNATLKVQDYFQDYQRTAIAIPFQILITDRTKTTDTSKWVTELYFPVM